MPQIFIRHLPNIPAFSILPTLFQTTRPSPVLKTFPSIISSLPLPPELRSSILPTRIENSGSQISTVPTISTISRTLEASIHRSSFQNLHERSRICSWVIQLLQELRCASKLPHLLLPRWEALSVLVPNPSRLHPEPFGFHRVGLLSWWRALVGRRQPQACDPHPGQPLDLTSASVLCPKSANYLGATHHSAFVPDKC